MSNQLSYLLQQWHPHKDQAEWVLGTIYDHHGPCYRKTGAMMLFNSTGQQLGMLSGGCLESDIGKNARKVMQTGQGMLLCYDGNDEDDMSFQLGIGCGGTVHIMLQLINADNNYLELANVLQALLDRTPGIYRQQVSVVKTTVAKINAAENNTAKTNEALVNEVQLNELPLKEAVFDLNSNITSAVKAQLTTDNAQVPASKWLATPIIPEPHMLIAGGGLDAQPMVAIAHQLGWRISLWDPRPANGRREHFLNANHIIQGNEQALGDYIENNQIDAAVVMSHNIILDAKAVSALSKSSIRYLALLGPEHRKAQVLTQANLHSAKLPFPIAGPAGLDIGAELPESIALAILSECHAHLNVRNAQSMSNVLTPAVQANNLRSTG